MSDPERQTTLTDAQCQPTGLDLRLADQVLQITWADGVTSEFPVVFLRKHCPCAQCRTDRAQQSKAVLPIMSAPPADQIRAVGGHVMGNYALQIDFADGHNTGIYDFRLLRKLAAELD